MLSISAHSRLSGSKRSRSVAPARERLAAEKPWIFRGSLPASARSDKDPHRLSWRQKFAGRSDQKRRFYLLLRFTEPDLSGRALARPDSRQQPLRGSAPTRSPYVSAIAWPAVMVGVEPSAMLIVRAPSRPASTPPNSNSSSNVVWAWVAVVVAPLT